MMMMMMMRVDQSVESVGGETEVLGRTLSQCHVVHHKSHMAWVGTQTAKVRSRRQTA
jgi:hypothetical protein